VPFGIAWRTSKLDTSHRALTRKEPFSRRRVLSQTCAAPSPPAFEARTLLRLGVMRNTMRLPRALHVLVWLCLAACGDPGAQPPAVRATAAALAVAEASPGTFRDPASGLTFDHGGLAHVRAERFGVHDPAKLDTTFMLSDAARTALVSIDRWANRAQLPLDRWIERYLGYALDEPATAVRAPLSRRAAPGLLIEKPRSPQAFGRRIAVVALGDSVVRVTCQRSDDAAATALFEQVVASLDLEAVRR
jgi:hypothetical protein